MSQRIILFGPLPPPYGGVAIYMKALVARLRDSKIRVWTYGGARFENSEVRWIAHRRLGTLWALLAEGSRARILDATHFHFEYPNPLLLPLWLILKCVLRFEWYKNVLDGSLPKRYPHFSKTQRWLFHRALNSVDKFLVVSDELRRWLKEEMNAPQPVAIVPCLLPRPPAEQLSNTTDEMIRPFLAHRQRVCSIGVFYPSYGFNDVARAVELLRESGEDIGLILLDGVFVRDEKYRDEVLRNRSWITVLEKVPNPQVYEILKQSDAFVRAFADESFGIARIEALWCGIPVVATRAGETRGMLLYDFGNIEQMVAQLRRALFQKPDEEIQNWAAQYRQEAEANLQSLKKELGLSE